MAKDFPSMLKSTIDKLISDKVALLQDSMPTLQWAEVDDMAQTDSVFKSDEPAIVWQFGTLVPWPKHPMYDFQFMVGAKTAQDPGNYALIALLGEVRDLFEQGMNHAVYDFTMAETDAADPVSHGYLLITGNEIEVQRFDRQSGVRYATVSAKAVSYGD